MDNAEIYHRIFDIEIEDVVLVDDILFFFSKNTNSFCKREKNGEIIKIASIPNEPIFGYRLYASMAYWNRNIYLIPFSAESIVVYNIDNETIQSISLSSALVSYGLKFRAYTLINEKIYLFALYTASIYSLDLVDNTFSLEANIESIQNNTHVIFDSEEVYFLQQVAVLGNKIYAPLANVNGLVVFDIITKESEFVQLGEEKRGYSGIAIKDNDVYLGARGKNGKCAIWNLFDRKIKYLDIDVRDVSVVFFEKSIPVFISAWDYSFAKVIGDKLFMFDMKNKCLRCRQEDDEITISTRIILNERDLQEYVHNGSILNEGHFISLKEFLIGV